MAWLLSFRGGPSEPVEVLVRHSLDLLIKAEGKAKEIGEQKPVGSGESHVALGRGRESFRQAPRKRRPPQPVKVQDSTVMRTLILALALANTPALGFGSLAAQAPTPTKVAPTAEDAALPARARAIHDAVLTLDTHKDISPALATDPGKDDDDSQRERHRLQFDPTVRGSNQVDFPKSREGGYDCAFYIVYVGQGNNDKAAWRRAKQQAMLKFDAIDRMCAKYPADIALARTPQDVLNINKSGRLVACIGIENGYPMGDEVAAVEEFWRRGARYMSICHNRHSQLGDSHTPDEPLHGGLSDLGKKAIAAMNHWGVMVDVSHAAKSTMMQTLAASKAPVIASHSGCRAVRDHGRNVDDEQLDALKKNRGVIQCVALGSFVKDDGQRDAAISAVREELGLPSRNDVWRMREDGKLTAEIEAKLAELTKRTQALDQRFPPANVSDFVDHIDHAVRRIGIDHVGIGSDFDGGGGVVGWNDASETFNVTLELVRRGYTQEQIAKIWSGNTLRLWGEVEAVAKRLQAASGDRR